MHNLPGGPSQPTRLSRMRPSKENRRQNEEPESTGELLLLRKSPQGTSRDPSAFPVTPMSLGGLGTLGWHSCRDAQSFCMGWAKDHGHMADLVPIPKQPPAVTCDEACRAMRHHRLRRQKMPGFNACGDVR